MSRELLNGKYSNFFEQLKYKVSTAQYKAAKAVNQELILLYHHIGTEILHRQQEFGWGSQVINQLSKDLTSAFPEMKGFSVANLHNMRRFADLYSYDAILQQPAGELPWYHHVMLMEKIKNPSERSFYIKQSVEHGWSRSVLTHQIESKLFERQGKAITNFKAVLPDEVSKLAQQALKDPYIFDFLSLGKEASEREIEKGLIAHMEKFLLELGSGFSFVGRQFHLEVAKRDFYLDLLFYHLKLRCFVVIELKAVDFEPEFAGKMNFYLTAVDKKLKHPTDNLSIGLLLCKTKDQVIAEYAFQDMTKPIGLAEYKITEALPENIKTELPSIEELERELAKDFEE